MTGTRPGTSPLDAVAGASAPAAAEAFALLSNETRLAILLALWESFEPFGEGGSVPFTELRKRVGMQDGSQFNYHLDRLVGHFVRHADDGYELRPAGLAVVWSVIAGTGTSDTEFEPVELDRQCPNCGAPTRLAYEESHLVLCCTRCEGHGAFDQYSDGVLFFSTFERAGLTNRTPEEALDACFASANYADGLLREGVCPSCSGPVDAELLVCESHDSGNSGELCPECGRGQNPLVKFTCTICKNGALRPPEKAVAWHPAVLAFYYERLTDEASVENLYRLQEEIRVRDCDLVSTDPSRLRLGVECAGEQLRLTLDEGANVVDVSR